MEGNNFPLDEKTKQELEGITERLKRKFPYTHSEAEAFASIHLLKEAKLQLGKGD